MCGLVPSALDPIRGAPFVAILILSIVAIATPSVATTFMGLGSDPALGGYSQAYAVSADGQVVVGVGGGARRAFRWDATNGATLLPGGAPVGPPFSQSRAVAASGDGSTAVGSLFSPFTAVTWDSTGTRSTLPAPTFSATGVSIDGSVVVGTKSPGGGVNEAYRWDAVNGVVGLGELPGGLVSSFANGVSADGGIVVGASFTANDREAFVWNSVDGMIGLGDLPGGGILSEALAVSSDGSTIVGYGLSAFGFEAFIWNQATGMTPLGDLPGGDFNSSAYAVSSDGSVVVGGSVATGQVTKAFLWDATTGQLRSIEDVLVASGVDFTGWNLRQARGISADGKTIVGWGIHSGLEEGWVVTLSTIPEPSTVFLVALGMTALSLRRREL